ncbi:CobW family GTP-binding protein [Lacrimispora defluvii]|uniref:GTP-binding protein n=1 Tax=Lacrimispora defluvii TaxID=2719233 RepID=A0ABX1VSJ8_9FIRM|nr:GTP-binding protein [Lacrimispora defluvii]NNJ31089.1 GTP-binding protein [Lacrimispora defluvii]
MTDLYIISGFLGAGKTTLIQTMVPVVFENRKIVVIENDFGDAGIDAELLKGDSLTVTSLNSGCICCSLNGDFNRSMEQIVKEYAPDVILVEPSGAGRLSDIIKVCMNRKDLVKLCRCITVVDVMNFDKYRENFGEVFINQIQFGDLILLSHLSGKAGEIQETMDKIRKLNPEARIEPDFWDGIPAEVFREGDRVSLTESLMEDLKKPAALNRKIRSGGKGECAVRPLFRFTRELFLSVSFDCEEVLTEAELKTKINRVTGQADGMILRGKGIVKGTNGSISFHYIPGMLKIQSSRGEGNSVCFIGTGIKEDQIISLFKGE